jgi:hypothetical protein
MSQKSTFRVRDYVDCGESWESDQSHQIMCGSAWEFRPYTVVIKLKGEGKIPPDLFEQAKPALEEVKDLLMESYNEVLSVTLPIGTSSAYSGGGGERDFTRCAPCFPYETDDDDDTHTQTHKHTHTHTHTRTHAHTHTHTRTNERSTRTRTLTLIRTLHVCTHTNTHMHTHKHALQGSF